MGPPPPPPVFLCTLRFGGVGEGEHFRRQHKSLGNFQSGLRILITLMRIRIRNQFFTLTRIRILLMFLIKVMQIFNHWSADLSRLYLEPPRLHSQPSTAPFLASKLLNFADADSDLDPASRTRMRNPASPAHEPIKKFCTVRYGTVFQDAVKKIILPSELKGKFV